MSELRRYIEADYRECVALTEMPADLKQALKAHERIPAFFKNLERELAQASKLGVLSRETIKHSVYSLTEFFINNVKREANERIMSDAMKAAAVQKATHRQEIEAAVDAAEEKAERTGGPVDLGEAVESLG